MPVSKPKFQAIYEGGAPGLLQVGQHGTVRCDLDKILFVKSFPGAGGVLVEPEAPASYNVLGASNGLVRNVATKIVEVHATNLNAAFRYLLLFDAIALPGAGSAPDTIPLIIGPGAHASLTFAYTQRFATGLYWCNSTTQQTLTLGGNDLNINVQYYDG